MTTNGEMSDAPRPRLCHLRRWPNFVGYGFNLHCEKSKPGQFIGKVDADSPAESANLREYDRIIEVNYVPIGNENHKQVVSRIKEGVTRNGTKYPEEVILLVLDPEADIYYKNQSIIVRSSDENVEIHETEIRDGTENGRQSPHSIEQSHSPIVEKATRTLSNESNREYKHVTDFTGPTVTHTTKTNVSPTISRTSDHDYEHSLSNHQDLPSSENASPKSQLKPINVDISRTSPSQISPSNGSGDPLEFKMSAAEYREKLKAQQARKRDPRQDQQLSMKQKHDLIDHL